jgi:hypothetical protein
MVVVLVLSRIRCEPLRDTLFYPRQTLLTGGNLFRPFPPQRCDEIRCPILRDTASRQVSINLGERVMGICTLTQPKHIKKVFQHLLEFPPFPPRPVLIIHSPEDCFHRNDFPRQAANPRFESLICRILPVYRLRIRR